MKSPALFLSLKITAIAVILLLIPVVQAQTPSISEPHSAIQCHSWNGFPENSKMGYILGYADGLDAGSILVVDTVIDAGNKVPVDTWKKADSEMDRQFPRTLTFQEIEGRLDTYCSSQEQFSKPIKTALSEIVF